MQCASGSYSASGASVCVNCSAGKYLTRADGSTEAASCTSVSRLNTCCELVAHVCVCIEGMGCVQCASGSYSASGASVCVNCSAGKYLTKADGDTEADSCTSVSRHMLFQTPIMCVI